jgi:hypothetical protein
VGDKGSARIHENAIIVIKDKGVNLNAKIKELIKNHVMGGVHYASVFIVDLADKNVLKAGYGFQESDLLYSSQLTYNKDASPSRASTGNNCTAMTYTINGADRKGIKLDKDTKDGYYLKDGEYYGLDTSSINNRDVIGDKTVYIFTDNQFNSLKVGERNFVNFLDYLVDEVQTNKDEIIHMLSKDNMRGDGTWKALQDIHKLTDVASIIDDYVLEYNDCQLDSRKIGYYEAITNIIRRHNHSLYQEIQKAIGDLDIKHCEAQNKIKEKYPLLKVLIDNRDFDGIIKQVAQYVDLVSTTIQKDGEV